MFCLVNLMRYLHVHQVCSRQPIKHGIQTHLSSSRLLRCDGEMTPEMTQRNNFLSPSCQLNGTSKPDSSTEENRLLIEAGWSRLYLIWCVWSLLLLLPALRKKAAIHQVTTMLATSKTVLFLSHNHLLTTGTNDPTLWLSPEQQRVKGHQYRWLAGGYDLEIGHF